MLSTYSKPKPDRTKEELRMLRRELEEAQTTVAAIAAAVAPPASGLSLTDRVAALEARVDALENP